MMIDVKEHECIIDKSRYLAFLLMEETLSRLERGGVDNWEQYNESLNRENEMNLDEYKEWLKNNIFLFYAT